MDTLLGELICHYRKEKGLSQEELANEFCSRKIIYNIEKGFSQPTLEIIGYLSEKLGIDLVEAYGNVRKHKDLNTHLKYIELSRVINSGSQEELEKEIIKYINDDNFQDGEPKQLLCYAKSVLHGASFDFEKACEDSLEGIHVAHPRYPKWDKEKETMSNVDYALFLSNAVNLCRKECKDEGLVLLEEMESRVKGLVTSEEGDFIAKRPYLIKIWCSCLYNQFVFADEFSEDFIERIDRAIEYQKRNQSVHMVPHLLLCKAAILMEKGKIQEALKNYNDAKGIYDTFFSKSGFEKVSKTTINSCSQIEKFR